jgi:MarR family 2-MHQ and catechol resistance regulon transcriptional repressor
MGTHYQGTAAERRVLDTYIKLLRAAESVAGATSAVPAAQGLAPTQFGVLEALYHLGPLCQRELAAKHLRSPANMTATVDRLERRGLVRRSRHGSDRRRVTIDLTPQGRRLIGGLLPAHVGRIVEVLGALGAAEQRQLGALCRKLGRSAATRGTPEEGR